MFLSTLRMPCGGSRALRWIISGLHFRTGVSGEGTAVFVHKRYSGTAAVDAAAFH